MLERRVLIDLATTNILTLQRVVLYVIHPVTFVAVPVALGKGCNIRQLIELVVYIYGGLWGFFCFALPAVLH